MAKEEIQEIKKRTELSYINNGSFNYDIIDTYDFGERKKSYQSQKKTLNLHSKLVPDKLKWKPKVPLYKKLEQKYEQD